MTTIDVPPAVEPAPLLPSLPGSYYTDPDVFAGEQARVFEAMWCCAVRLQDFAACECTQLARWRPQN